MRGSVWSMLALMLVASGCGSKLTDAPPRTIEPARAAVSPPPATAPAGEVLALGARAQAALFDTALASLVVFAPGSDPQTPATLTILGAAGAARTVVLPGAVTAIAGDGRGMAYASTRGGFVTVDLATGATEPTMISGEAATDFIAIARRADGRLVLGSANGVAYTLGSDLTVSAKSDIFARVDAIVTEGDTAVILDRGQTSVTALNSEGSPMQSLRAGLGATTIAADPAGRVLVADTRGGQLLVFSAYPLIERQAYPVSESPFGITGSKTLVWVSQTASNQVIGYDLATGIPVEKVRYPTVRQPNSLVIDDTSGTLYVVSGSGDGVQVIRNAAGGR